MAEQFTEQSGAGQGVAGALYNLVVIGSSAGGIEALSTVLGALAQDFPAPIVVAQHLDPTRISHLDAILARRTVLPVQLVTDVAPLAPGTVYVVPSDRDLEITDHEVRVRASLGTPSKPSVNRLLSSAARVYGEGLIAVILTGTGSDGADGTREVKATGGMVIIEDPATAAFPGMPRSLSLTTVDFVAHLEQIGPLLSDLLAGSYVPGPLDPDYPEAMLGAEEQGGDDVLGPLLAQLRERSGIDFTGYRRPTILRRLQQRMAITKSPRLDDYRRYLARHPDEYPRLVSSFLIKVTEFFRDAEFFDALREWVLPELIAQARTHGNQLRLWSVGCATGEEAYSLAILLAEALGPELSQFTVRLFATDLDERAVAFARQATYPAAALAGVSEELRARYFTQLDGADGPYEVKKPIRALVTCGEHDLGRRPPFPHIDLVLCRNVLIYFTPEMQQRSLALFAYALRPGGYLALGKAESARALSDYFAQADPDLKLYRRVGEKALPPMLLQPKSTFSPSRQAGMRGVRAQSPRHATTEAEPTWRAGMWAEQGQGERMDDWLADEKANDPILDFPIGVVTVDRRYHIRTINSAALRLLDIYRPAIGEDLIHVAERMPGPALRHIIDAVFQASASPGEGRVAGAEVNAGTPSQVVVTEVLALQTGLGERRDVEVAAYPYAPRRGGAWEGRRVETAMLLITDVSSTVEARVAAELSAARARSSPEQAIHHQSEEMNRLATQLEEVRAVNRQLVAANQELGSVNLELQRVNDGFLLAQEQEQASAEEIRTLNEEMQASNEELETVNEELEATVEELRASNDDLAARTQEVQELANTVERRRLASETERAQLAAILLSMGDAVLVVDSAETPLLTNRMYSLMFGAASTPFVAGDAEGRPLEPEATPQRRAARGETFLMEFTHMGVEKTLRYFEANGQPIQSVGEALGGVIVVRDITERSLHHLQDEFVALASHELRTPLTPLQAYLQMLNKVIADTPENARAHEYIAHARDQVQRIWRLVQDLLDVRRLQQGGFALEIARVQYADVVRRSVEAARLMAPAGLAIDLEIAAGAFPVEADAVRLEQVLMNLLTNAITHAPHSPRISVRLFRVGSEAVAQVQDMGPGISAAHLPHIFTRFYQVANINGRPSRHGLGLGLYIAHKLVEAHGGSLEVTSVEAPADGHGATFTIRLPLALDGTSEQPDQGPVDNEPKGRRRAR